MADMDLSLTAAESLRGEMAAMEDWVRHEGRAADATKEALLRIFAACTDAVKAMDAAPVDSADKEADVRARACTIEQLYVHMPQSTAGGATAARRVESPIHTMIGAHYVCYFASLNQQQREQHETSAQQARIRAWYTVFVRLASACASLTLNLPWHNKA